MIRLQRIDPSKDTVEQFVDSLTSKAKADAQWQAFVTAKKAEELERITAGSTSPRGQLRVTPRDNNRDAPTQR